MGETKTKLRFDFIGMAFALALGQVGLEIGEFYSYGLSIFDYPYVFSQLLLGTYIIASSWVGWNKSISKGNLETINNTFGKPFIILLIDLFMVICYFIIVKGVEKPYLTTIQENVDGEFELRWAIIIIISYIVWDLITKLIDFDSKNFKLRLHFKVYLERGYQAFICLLLLIILYINSSSESFIENVFWIDIYILFVFLLFRGMKEKMNIEGRHKNVILSKYLLYRIIPLIMIFALYYRINFY